MKLLIGANADTNIKNNEGLAELHVAARYSSTDGGNDTVKLLVDANADFNMQDNGGYTALYYPIKNNIETNKQLVDILVKAGANIMKTLGQTNSAYLGEVVDGIRFKIKKANIYNC